MSGYVNFAVLGNPSPGQIPQYQADGSVIWVNPPSSGGQLENAVSLLAGLPYVVTTDPAAAAVLQRTLDVVAGDIIVIESYVEVANQNAVERAVNLVNIEDGVDLQTSSAITLASGNPVDLPGTIQELTMKIAFPTALTGTITYGVRVYATDVGVVAPQVFFSVKNLGQ